MCAVRPRCETNILEQWGHNRRFSKVGVMATPESKETRYPRKQFEGDVLNEHCGIR